jgi:SAM-dependent methyltransferase
MQAFGTIYRLHSLLCEFRLNISTSGRYDSPWATPEHVFYSSVWYSEIFSVLRYLQLSQSDVFVDLGCGKGRVVCCAARYPIRRAIGVDDVEELTRAATSNAQTVRNRRAEISIVRCKAEDFDFSEATVLYLYNPFGAYTLQTVLDRIRNSLDTHRREIKIAYVNPKHDEVLERMQWLERYTHWPRRPSRGFEFAVSFWRSRPSQTAVASANDLT